MYHKYHTDALVLGSSPFGEGSKTLSLFTRELGLLTAFAQSVREERSKLRYGLQDFMRSEVAVVRGREFWRVTHVASKENVLQTLSHSPEASRVVGRVCALLRRLLTGEEKNEPLFVAVCEGVRFMATQRHPAGIAGAEIVLVLRILYLLGYLAPRGEFSPFLSDFALWDESVISRALSFRSIAIAEINHSLRQSQL